MGHDQRRGGRSLATFVDEMDSKPVRYESVVMKGRESLHLRLPIEFILPIAANFAEKMKIDSILERGTRSLVNPACARQTAAKVVDSSGIGKRQTKRLHAHCTSG